MPEPLTSPDLRELEQQALTQLVTELEEEGLIVLADALPAGVLAERILERMDSIALWPEEPTS